MSEMVETDLGLLPKTWPLKPVGEVFQTQLGKMLSTKAKTGKNSKPYLRNKNVQWGKIDVSDLLEMDFDERERKKFALVPGDLLLCEGGVVGRAALWHGEVEDCYFQKALHRLRPANGSVTNEFMLYWLRFAFEIQNFYGVSGASSTIAHLPAAQLRALDLPVPPLPEQKKIAHILSTVQRAIEGQERIIQTTTELKKALMHKLFTEGLRNEPQKQTEIGPVPESWDVVRIKATGTVVTGSTPSTKNPEFYGDGYNLISPADLDNGKYVRSAHKTLTKAGFEKCRAIPRESVLVGCIGNVGKLGMVGDDCSATNQQINAVTTNSQFNPHFLYYALQFCRPRLEQAAAKVTVPILNKSNFENFQIASPLRAEQDEIAGCLGVLDQKLENAGQKKAQLQDLFRTLLHELMTAKTRVHELELSA